MTNRDRVPVAVLASGRGTNLEALLAASALDDFPAEIVLVVCNRTTAPALEVARRHGVTAVAMPLSEFGGDGGRRDLAMRDRLRAAGVRLVVCAGYDRILSDEFLQAFAGSMLNVHPSLLPAFGGGMTGVEDALAYGVKVTGCTVQLLEPGLADGGPIVLQAAVPVLEDDDADTLRSRVHEAEWRILPDAVALWCEDRLERHGRRVRILPAHPPAARRVMASPPR